MNDATQEALTALRVVLQMIDNSCDAKFLTIFITEEIARIESMVG